ncbi:hypothetical protein [Paraburkholderia bannensis]|uniref:hypothetical protein n=1 Tax=Paraburkholderia bannensis TaxID=765414 RepID=UPI002ABD95E6|nr:hypothetical protein [Paraburkholderia bannensis]
MAARIVPRPSIAMNFRHALIAIYAIAMTSGAYAQTGVSDLTPRRYGSPLQQNMNAATAPASPKGADAARRCGELAKTYADSYSPQSPNYAAVGSPNYGRDGRNYEMDNDLAVRNRREDAENAYRDSGCH